MTDWGAILAGIGGIIGAIGGVYGIYTKYTQDSKNKRTEYEIEKLRNEDKVENRRRSDNAMMIFGSLWDLLYTLKADRVYIVQPHPLGNEEMLTIYFEVKRRHVEAMKGHIQRLKISEVACFAKELVKNLFMYISDIGKQIKDRYAESIFSSCGTKHAIVKRLNDNRHDWVGSIICEFTGDMEVTEHDAKEILHRVATEIQYILPEIRE